jgi:carbon monoxide dehydrogenase subunit G
MKLEQSFEVQAPLGRVWEMLVDVERVAPCVPGADVTEVGEDGVYRGTFTVKVGPTTAAYRGELRIDSLDETAHRATLHADGSDARGQGGARATVTSTLTETDGRTRVEIDTDFTITGRLASFGRGGMMEDISKRLLDDFANCLRSRLEQESSAAEASVTGAAAPQPAKAQPIKGLALLASVLWERITRIFRRRR